MPTRTEEERQLIDSLPIKAPSKTCNARTPNGYCRLNAGYGTDHLGEGRCEYHGGRAGRSPTHGMYSKHLTSTVKEEYDKLVTSPTLVDLQGELALIKSLLNNFMANIEDKLNDDERNWWVQNTKAGKTVSAEANALLRLLEQISKIYEKIINAEQKMQDKLTVRDVYIILNQIKINMNETCGNCPVRNSITNKLQQAKIAEVVNVE